MSTSAAAAVSSADGVAWDLNDLYAGPADPQLDVDIARADERARAFRDRYEGRVAELDAAAMRDALAELEDLSQLADRPLIFAHLLHAADSSDPAHGALIARAAEANSQVRAGLLFFELEWLALPDDHTEPMIADPASGRFAHFLRKGLAFRPHVLARPVEEALEQKSNTGSRAFKRLFDEITSGLECDVDLPSGPQRLNESATLALLHDHDREVRRAAARGLTGTLHANSKVLTYIFNVLLQDHNVDDQLRSREHPMQARNLANEISQESVDALIAACTGANGMVQRYYRLKTRLLGLEKLYDYDRYAPLEQQDGRWAWDRCRQMVTDSYAAFDPRAGEIVELFFERSWIDAELRNGKRGGAFSAGGPADAHPYILCNYTDRARDVMTVAHELGHGIHQYLARDVGYLQSHTPLTMAETASVFGEMIVFYRLLEGSRDPGERLSLLAGKIEDSFATVFRQIVLTQFERAAHAARRSEGELSSERIGELWMEANAPMHGDVVELTPDYASWWSYIPHFIHTPFYTYAYSFGHLLVLALYATYRREGPDFVPGYLEMLQRGGSASPKELVAPLGVDLDDPGLWQRGLALIEDMIVEAEALAAGRD
jgi:oligoendopeptidase F